MRRLTFGVNASANSEPKSEHSIAEPALVSQRLPLYLLRCSNCRDQAMSDTVTNSETDRIFVFQGGGALGAYQAGAYEALHENELEPDWLAGISIGAVNAAIIAGSPREKRIPHLRDFWHTVSSSLDFGWAAQDNTLRRMQNDAAAMAATMFGVPGFFSPRLLTPKQLLENSDTRVSYYDTGPLLKTLERLIDFDLLNDCQTRLSLGAVEIRSGNFAYFDNRQSRLDVRHIAASGALPPGFALLLGWRSRVQHAAAACAQRQRRHA
jgi:NTE family protein